MSLKNFAHELRKVVNFVSEKRNYELQNYLLNL